MITHARTELLELASRELGGARGGRAPGMAQHEAARAFSAELESLTQLTRATAETLRGTEPLPGGGEMTPDIAGSLRTMAESVAGGAQAHEADISDRFFEHRTTEGAAAGRRSSGSDSGGASLAAGSGSSPAAGIVDASVALSTAAQSQLGSPNDPASLLDQPRIHLKQVDIRDMLER